CEVPRLLLDLMNKCLDAEPQYRQTAEELANTLNQFRHNYYDKETELYKQVKGINNSGKFSNQVITTRLNYKTHKQAIYSSRLLKYHNLSKPLNAKSVVA
ncbi:12812_t:CDS:1, partial [Cetraspora pellucida]